MGVIQNNINAAMGAVSGALVAGTHIANQTKQNELAKANLEISKLDTEREKANLEAKLGSVDEDLLFRGLADADLTAEETEKLSSSSDKAGDYLALKTENAKQDTLTSAQEYTNRLEKYKSGEQKSKPSSKRLEKAKEAFDSLRDETNARNNLKFDIELTKKKIDAINLGLGGKR